MKSISKVWTFKSESNPNKTYQTLQYHDATTSCDCPSWTRRCDGNGTRTCRHVRSVQLGAADAEAISFHGYTSPGLPPALTSASPHSVIPNPQSIRPFQRKLCLK